jgi:hypothetical protein
MLGHPPVVGGGGGGCRSPAAPRPGSTGSTALPVRSAVAASAIRLSPRSSRTPGEPSTTVIGMANGGGLRSVTAAGSAASKPSPSSAASRPDR